MNDTLFSQDKLLKHAAYEREFKDKLEIMLKKLEAAKKCAVVVSNEFECDECAIHILCLMRMMS
jgi:hypothetical protein